MKEACSTLILHGSCSAGRFFVWAESAEPAPKPRGLQPRLGVPDYLPAGSFWAQMERVYAGVTVQALELAFAELGSE